MGPPSLPPPESILSQGGFCSTPGSRPCPSAHSEAWTVPASTGSSRPTVQSTAVCVCKGGLNVSLWNCLSGVFAVRIWREAHSLQTSPSALQQQHSCPAFPWQLGRPLCLSGADIPLVPVECVPIACSKCRRGPADSPLPAGRGLDPKVNPHRPSGSSRLTHWPLLPLLPELCPVSTRHCSCPHAHPTNRRFITNSSSSAVGTGTRTPACGEELPCQRHCPRGNRHREVGRFQARKQVCGKV